MAGSDSFGIAAQACCISCSQSTDGCAAQSEHPVLTSRSPHEIEASTFVQAGR